MLLLLSISSFNIIDSKIDNYNTKEEIINIKESVEIKSIKENKYDKLIRKNNYFVGILNVNGTNINYPFVKYSDNDYYLNHSFDNKKNKAGWIFMDYRNNINFSDSNTIIYGHNRFDGSMFGSLKNILTSKWQKNKKNYIIKISTSKKIYSYKVFSIYKVTNTNDYLLINFNNESDHYNFIELITKRSKYDFKEKVNNEDKILTLSTCSGSKHKLVLHAKLIKIQ